MKKIFVFLFLLLFLSGCTYVADKTLQSKESEYTEQANSAFDHAEVTLKIKEP